MGDGGITQFLPNNVMIVSSLPLAGGNPIASLGKNGARAQPRATASISERSRRLFRAFLAAVVHRAAWCATVVAACVALAACSTKGQQKNKQRINKRTNERTNKQTNQQTKHVPRDNMGSLRDTVPHSPDFSRVFALRKVELTGDTKIRTQRNK